MQRIFVSAIALISLTSIAAASECKGLDQTACGANSACKWIEAHKTGDVSKASGKAYKSDRKAFCRSGSKTASAKPAATPASAPAPTPPATH